MKSFKTKKTFLSLSILFFTLNLFALPVTEYKISGLKNTKKDTLTPYLDTFIGKDSSEIDLHEIETTLRSYGIFSDIKVKLLDYPSEKRKAEKLLTINLKEKITFIPLPFGFYSSTNYGGGLFVLDSNALGRKDLAIIGGMFLSDKLFGMLGYSHAPDEKSLGWTAFASAGKIDTEFTDIKNDSLLKFSSFEATANFSLSERINSFCKTGQSIAYTYTNYSDSKYKDTHKISAGLSFEAGTVDWNGYFMLSKSLTLQAEADYYSGGDISENASVKLVMQHTFFTDRIRAIVEAKGKIENDVPFLQSMEAGDEGARILSEYFHTDKFAMAKLSLETAVLKSSFLTLSLLASYEVDFANDYDNSAVFCHGPGAGLYLYLEKIALPALGFTYSYNISENYPTFNFALGASF